MVLKFYDNKNLLPNFLCYLRTYGIKRSIKILDLLILYAMVDEQVTKHAEIFS